MNSRKSQIICSEQSLKVSLTSLAFSLLIAGALPVYGLQTETQSSLQIAKSSNNMDSDVFEPEQMIKEEPRTESQPQLEPQPQSEAEATAEEMRYEKQVERIEPPQLEPQPIVQRSAKRAKASPDIREVVPDGKTLPQNFENMKKKVKQKRGRKQAEEEMPPVAPRIVPYSQAQAQTKKSDPQEESLQKLVHELEYGTLDRSIKVLRELISNYPEDTDYKKLLDMALSLKDADTWYSYQRNTPSPSMSQGDEDRPKPQPKRIPQIQASSDNPRVNELKRSSWLLIKNNYRKN